MEPMLDFLVDERARRLRAEADEMRRARGRPARRPFRRPWRRHAPRRLTRHDAKE